MLCISLTRIKLAADGLARQAAHRLALFQHQFVNIWLMHLSHVLPAISVQQYCTPSSMALIATAAADAAFCVLGRVNFLCEFKYTIIEFNVIMLFWNTNRSWVLQ